MPQVPQYSQRTVQEQSLPNARVTANAPAEAFGGGQASDGVVQAQDRLLGVVGKVQEQADDLRLVGSRTELTNVHNDLLYGNEGLLSLKGQAALGAPDDLSARYKDSVDKIRSGLSTERQRQRFDQLAMQDFASFNGEIKRHVFSESQRLADETIKAGIDTASNDAILNYHDPGKIAQAVELQRSLIRKNVRGFAPEQVQAFERDAVSRTHAGVIERMLANGEDLGAKQYYDQVKPDMSGDLATRLEKALEVGSVAGESTRLSDQIMAKRLSMSKALEEVRQIEDPRLRDATTDRIRQGYALQNAARRDQDEKLALNATNIIERTGDFNKIPPGDVAQMSLSMRSALKSYARQKAEGLDAPTDWNTYYNLKTMASSPATKDKFLQMNLMEHVSDLAKPEFKEMINLQTALRQGDGKAEKALDGYRSDSQIVMDSLQAAGFNTKAKPGSSTSKQINQFKRMVDEQIAAFAQSKGKKPNNEEVQGIADSLLIKGITSKGFLYDNKKRLFELTPDDSFDVDVKDVPARDRQMIESSLKARGIQVTDDKIKSVYQAKLNKMVNRGQ